MTIIPFLASRPRPRTAIRGVALVAAPLLASLALVAAPGFAEDRARFVVTDEVVNADLPPFTATIASIGNDRGSAGFEPTVFRTMIRTRGAAPDRIVASRQAISHFDSWRGGALDGAEVEILRIENGAFRSVRRDRIAEGGHRASGWVAVTSRGRVVDPEATDYTFTWEPWNRPGVPYHFTVRAVDRDGALSAPATHVAIEAPDRLPRKAPDVENALVKAETSTKESRRLAAPEDLAATLTDAGTVRLEWSEVSGAAGYVVYRSDTPPSEHRGYDLILEGSGPALEAGDLAIIRKVFYRADRETLLTNRVWNANQSKALFAGSGLPGWSDELREGGWELRPHEADTPVETPGETYLSTALGVGETLSIVPGKYAGTGQTWYDILDPERTYRLEVWIRGQGPKPVSLELTGFYGGKVSPRGLPARFRPTGEWQKYSVDFRVPKLHTGRAVGEVRLHLSGPGRFDVDNIRLYRADTPFLDLLPQDVERLEASAMGALRTHAFIKTGHSTYDLHQFTNPAGVTRLRGGNTLPQTLRQMERVGMDPWLQIEPHFSREEWLGLAEYLAAPFDPASDDADALPWAAKRAAQGHAPWTERFDRILFEVGNETWNWMFRPWVFENMEDAATGERYTRGQVYGLYQNYVLSILRESPHWPKLAQKLRPVIGGWSGLGWSGFDYGLEAAALSPQSPFLTHAAYIGGWDEKTGPTRPTAESLFGVLTHVLQAGIPRAERHAAAAERISEERGTPLLVGTYESGPGYALNGLNGQKVTKEQAELQEFAMKSVAAGTATLDSFLMRARHGQVLQNYFLYGSGQTWRSHAHWQDGGQTYPSWDLLALFNRVGLGDMLAVETLEAPTADLQGARRREPVEDAPLVAAYATRTAERLTLVVVSRRVPDHPAPNGGGATDVTVELPIARAGRLTRYSQTGDWLSHNVDETGSRVVAETLPVPDSLPSLEIAALPPGETQVYVFEDLD